MKVYLKQHKTDMDKIARIRQEIERRRIHFNKEAEKYQALNNGYSQNCYGARDALRDLENFIVSLQQEQPSEDLEEAARHSEILSYPMPEDGDIEKVMKVQEARIFHEIGFKAGAEWQKQQMLKEAVEASVNYYENIPGGSYVELVADILNPTGVRYKDKVKIVIVKEDVRLGRWDNVEIYKRSE